MENPFRTFISWRRRDLERARHEGGVRLFWFYMTMGLVWGLLMTALAAVMNYYHKGALVPDDMWNRAFVCFGGGLFFGLFMWLMNEVPGAGRRDVNDVNKS
jgi:hypothetical protein